MNGFLIQIHVIFAYTHATVEHVFPYQEHFHSETYSALMHLFMMARPIYPPVV